MQRGWRKMELRWKKGSSCRIARIVKVKSRREAWRKMLGFLLGFSFCLDLFFFFARDLLVSRCTYRCNAACYAAPFLLNNERICHRMLDRPVSSLTSSPTRPFCVQKVNRLRSNNGGVWLSDYLRQFFYTLI